MAITWKNIDGPDLSRFARPLHETSQSILDGFSQLRDTFDGFADQQRGRAEVAFREAMNRYSTPEDLQAAMASGEFDALRQQYGSLIDQQAAMDAPRNRLTDLRNHLLADQTYGDNQTRRAEQPLIDQYMNRFYQNDETAGSVMADAGQSGLSQSGLARLRDALYPADRDRVEHLRAGEQHESNMANDQVSRAFNQVRTEGQQYQNEAAKLLVGEENQRRLGEEIIFGDAERHNRAAAEYGNAWRSVAAHLKVPQLADGFPDFDGMTDQQYNAYQDTLASQGIPMPQRDTDAYTTSMARLSQAGLSNKLVNELRKEAQDYFNSKKPLVGTDAERFQKQMDRLAKTPGASGTLQESGNLDTMGKFVRDNIKDSGEVDKMMRVIGEIAKTGIEVDGATYHPTLDTVRSAVLESSTGLFNSHARRARHLKDILIRRYRDDQDLLKQIEISNQL